MLFTVSGVAQQTYVELILDASGSMWNKMDDDRTRIQVAKEVLKDFIQGLPEGDINVGLRIYGSEVRALEPGSCEDSKLFVPLQGVDKPSMIQNVDDATAQGSTPIAYSLRLAAQDFPADAGKRLIVIVTDGEESCEDGLDAVVAELQAMGIEIDLQIIGLDLNERAIESFQDVGTFVNAESAAELASALEVAVEEVIVEEVVEETCDGYEASIQPASEIYASSTFITTIDGSDGALYLHPIGGDEYSSIESAFKSGGNAVELFAPSVAGSYELRYKTISPECLLATVQIDVLEIQATIDAPAQVEAGYEFTFSFDGPEGRIGFFDVGEASNSWREQGYDYYATAWDDVNLRAPSTPAMYEIRYIDRNNVTVATTTIEVIEASITLDVPEEVEAAYEFAFTFGGPDGRIAIYDTDDAEGGRNYGNYSYYATVWSDVKLLAPSEAGEYEIRYTDENGTVIATRSLTVSPSLASLETPVEVESGYEFAFTFSGPEGRIAIFDTDDTDGGRNYNDYSYYVTAWNAVKLLAPSEAGDYEIRYIDENGTVIATRPITVLPSLASLEIPAEVEAGFEFAFSYSGPEGRIAIYETTDVDGGRNYNDYSYYVTAWNDVKLLAPSEAGDYEVRYVDDNGSVIATQLMTVLPSQATLTVPAEVESGYEFNFSYSGPEGRIAIYETTDVDGGRNYNDYSYFVTQWDNPKLLAPSEAGDYEVRYVDDNGNVIATQPITVLASQATLTLPAEVEAGYNFNFSYSGPKGRIAIYETTDVDGGKNYNDYSYFVTQWDNPKLLAPSEAGTYEVRYVDDNRNVIVTEAFTVTPSQATLSLPSQVAVEQEFNFEYSGPDGRIAIYDLSDTQAGKNYNNYSYYVTTWDNVKLTAPETAGTYEVRYVDGNDTVIVTQTLTVQ